MNTSPLWRKKQGNRLRNKQARRHQPQDLQSRRDAKPAELALAPHPAFARVTGLQHLQSEFSQNVHHFRRVLRSRTAVVFLKGHVQHPVQIVLDRPMFSLDAQKVFCLRFFQTVNEIMVFSGRLVILVIDVTGIADPTHSRDASPVFKSFEPAQVVGEVTFSFLDAAMVLFQGNSVLSFGFEFSCASVLQFAVQVPDDVVVSFDCL